MPKHSSPQVYFILFICMIRIWQCQHDFQFYRCSMNSTLLTHSFSPLVVHIHLKARTRFLCVIGRIAEKPSRECWGTLQISRKENLSWPAPQLL
uniref:Secreted protein n=1 Tax=Physcomitrium patens TaxID=3218 RepID=A0A2K1JXD5_PHYPA|nr:hypothetical protein PHYPA_013309 [Physcomitrium patens]